MSSAYLALKVFGVERLQPTCIIELVWSDVVLRNEPPVAQAGKLLTRVSVVSSRRYYSAVICVKENNYQHRSQYVNAESVAMKLLLLLLAIATVNAVDDCPEFCTCTRPQGGAIATCTRLNASQLFPDDIIHFVLKSDQEHVSFEHEIFRKVGLDQLFTIVAVNTSLDSVHVNAFAGLNKLSDVDLSDNEIILIHPDTFKTNTNLKSLTLSGNPLQLTQVLKSEQDYFLISSSLRNLDLSRCQLTELKPNTFSNLRNLEYLNLASNNLKELDPETFSSVKFLDEINLSNNNIVKLATELFYDIEDLTILNLSNNSLINVNNIDIADLKQLDISGNRLTEINALTFEGVPDLTHLYVRNNLIESISEDAFTNLAELRYLDLSYNRIKAPLPKYLLEQNKDLETLSFAGNENLKHFNGFIGEFNVLYKLDLSNCGLETLGNGSLKSMPYIAILNLSRNAFSELHKNTFEKLHRLNDLDLSHNNLTRLDTDLFANNSHLRKLNLSSNKIHHIPITLFKPLPMLTILDLSNNLISYLWHLNNSEYIKAHHILAKVEYLNLNGNQLKWVHRTNFETFVGLKTLDIFNNPLQCGPLFATFIEWLISHNITSAKYVGKSENMELVTDMKNIQWQVLWGNVCNETYKKPMPEKYEESSTLREREEINNTIYITDRVESIEFVSDEEFVKQESTYLWPVILFVLCGVSVFLAVGNLLVLVVYKLRGSNSYKISGYKSAFIAPFRHTGMKTDGSSRYQKLYEECSVPNPPIAKSKVFTAPILDSLAKLHYSVITKPESKDENLI